MRYHLLTTSAGSLPKRFDDENFDFYGRILNGQPEQARTLEALLELREWRAGRGVGQGLCGAVLCRRQQSEDAGDGRRHRGCDGTAISTSWTGCRRRPRCARRRSCTQVANKIGYPDKWRDYSKLEIKPDDALGNALRAEAFENDRQLNKIGKPVDHSEWGMTPPTVNAYYDPSMNDINFPAGILQPSFYDPKQDDAVNYGHIGAVIGHELTHGFDDEGKKFDGKGNLSDWWTAEDTKNFEAAPTAW